MWLGNVKRLRKNQSLILALSDMNSLSADQMFWLLVVVVSISMFSHGSLIHCHTVIPPVVREGRNHNSKLLVICYCYYLAVYHLILLTEECNDIR